MLPKIIWLRGNKIHLNARNMLKPAVPSFQCSGENSLNNWPVVGKPRGLVIVCCATASTGWRHYSAGFWPFIMSFVQAVKILAYKISFSLYLKKYE